MFDVSQDISIAGARVISGGESLLPNTTDFVDSSSLQFGKVALRCTTCSIDMAWHDFFAADPLALLFLVAAL